MSKPLTLNDSRFDPVAQSSDTTGSNTLTQSTEIAKPTNVDARGLILMAALVFIAQKKPDGSSNLSLDDKAT